MGSIIVAISGGFERGGMEVKSDPRGIGRWNVDIGGGGRAMILPT